MPIPSICRMRGTKMQCGEIDGMRAQTIRLQYVGSGQLHSRRRHNTVFTVSQKITKTVWNPITYLSLSLCLSLSLSLFTLSDGHSIFERFVVSEKCLIKYLDLISCPRPCRPPPGWPQRRSLLLLQQERQRPTPGERHRAGKADQIRDGHSLVCC